MSKVQDLENRLAELQARRDGLEETRRVAELEAKVTREARELEEDEFAEQLKADRPDGELGIHFDFLRFGNYLVPFVKPPGPLYERWIKRLPEKGQPHPSEVKNLARGCVLEEHRPTFEKACEEFPGAAVDIVNVLLAMAQGAAARRKGK